MKALKFKNLESGEDTSSADGPVATHCPHGMAAPPPWDLTQLQERAVLALGARHALEAMATPGETSPAPP